MSRKPNRLASAVPSEAVSVAKRLLFEGRSQLDVAALTGISQPTLSRIRAGKSHADVPWPDGTCGPMPEKDAAIGPRWSTDAARFLDMPTEFQNRVLELVNERRAEIGMPPMPTSSENYQALLEDPTFALDPDAAQAAQAAEDQRISTLMREFDGLLSEALVERSDERIQDILEQTSALTASPPEPTPSPEPPKYQTLAWGSVQQLDLHLVRRAVQAKDYLYLEAISAVLVLYENFGVDNIDMLDKLVRQFRSLLEPHVELVKRIEEKWRLTLEGAP